MNKIFLILPVAAMVAMGCSSGQKTGVVNGRLLPCPGSPNCVSSQSPDGSHKMNPIKYNEPVTKAMEKLEAVLSREKRVKIITSEPDYIHAVFSSNFFRFKDDVEFYADDSNKVIHFRSASRLGYSDFGANRKRMEKIKNAFNKE